MADQSETTITLTDAPDDDERAVIMEGLRAYNEAQAGLWDGRPLAILARDTEAEKVVGGLLGRTSLGLLTVERFFLPEDLRRDRLGSRILAMAEEEGRRRGCTRAALSTLHFQFATSHQFIGQATMKPTRSPIDITNQKLGVIG
jgi:GNAT superfamily N-acetyltransferase